MDLFQIAAISGAVIAIAIFAARPVIKPKQTSPTPQTFEIGLADAYQRILKLLSNEKVGAHRWEITDSIENQYIITELTYSDTKMLQVKGVVNFDFKRVNEKQTTVRWFCKWDVLSDIPSAEKVERLTDSWLRTALTDSGHSVETITLNSQFETKLSQDRTYDRLFNRLSAGTEGTTSWTVNSYSAPSSLSAEVQTINLDNRKVTCCAKVDFTLTTDEKLTKVHCQYQFEPRYSMQTIQPWKQLTDDWIKLVLWTA